MNKVVEDLKRELRNAEVINKVVAEEKAKPSMEDIVGTPKHRLGEI